MTMKTLGMLRVLEVLYLALRTLLCLPHIWAPLLHIWRLQQVAGEWRVAGHHNTLVGRFWESLAAVDWLAPSQDPIIECGVPFGGGLTETLQRLHGAYSYLACLEKEVEQAKQEHLAFWANLLVAAACAASVTMLAALLAACGCLLLRLARRPQQQQQQAAEAVREVVPLVRRQEVRISPGRTAQGLPRKGGPALDCQYPQQEALQASGRWAPEGCFVWSRT